MNTENLLAYLKKWSTSIKTNNPAADHAPAALDDSIDTIESLLKSLNNVVNVLDPEMSRQEIVQLRESLIRTLHNI